MPEGRRKMKFPGDEPRDSVERVCQRLQLCERLRSNLTEDEQERLNKMALEVQAISDAAAWREEANTAAAQQRLAFPLMRVVI
jgi:hypothetical protein